MIYLLDKATTTARWNGIPLHEAKKGELKEILNGDGLEANTTPMVIMY